MTTNQITAAEARALQLKTADAIATVQLEEIFKSIHVAISNGKSTIYHYERVLDSVISKLQKLGYVASAYDCQRDGYCLTISW